MPLFASAVYLLCFFTSAACAWLLGRSYRRSRAPLLLWSALCFFLLALNNLMLVVDLMLIESIDFRLTRALLAFAAVAVLLFGFIWNDREE